MRRIPAVALVAALALMLGAPASYALAGDGGVWATYGGSRSAPDAVRPAHAPSPAVAADATRVHASGFARSAASHPAAAGGPRLPLLAVRAGSVSVRLHAAECGAASLPASPRAPPRRN